MIIFNSFTVEAESWAEFSSLSSWIALLLSSLNALFSASVCSISFMWLSFTAWWFVSIYCCEDCRIARLVVFSRSSARSCSTSACSARNEVLKVSSVCLYLLARRIKYYYCCTISSYLSCANSNWCLVSWSWALNFRYSSFALVTSVSSSLIRKTIYCPNL